MIDFVKQYAMSKEFCLTSKQLYYYVYCHWAQHGYVMLLQGQFDKNWNNCTVAVHIHIYTLKQLLCSEQIMGTDFMCLLYEVSEHKTIDSFLRLYHWVNGY